MIYTPPEGVTIGSFTANTLPASFSAPAGGGISYNIYGTATGVGTATSEGEPEGYKITLSVNDTPIPIYIGDTKLGAEEYVDVSDQKVYKRTENLFTEEGSGLVQIAAEGAERYGKDIGVLSAGTYTIDYTLSPPDLVTLWLHTVKNGVYTAVQIISHPYTFTLNEDKDVIFRTSSQQSDTTWQTLGVTDIMLVSGSTIPETYVPYLQPTDPPAPFPSIITYDGVNTISSTESLGDVELTGDWLAIMGSTEDESIDIGFTVDAEEYIAHVTVDDGPSIQVSDTITMPASADSFTLEVVSWGRERYTETVYNALS